MQDHFIAPTPFAPLLTKPSAWSTPPKAQALRRVKPAASGLTRAELRAIIIEQLG